MRVKFLVLLFICLSICFGLSSQSILYIVNSSLDIDDGTCDLVHCSLREAINASENDNSPSHIFFDSSNISLDRIFLKGRLPTITKDGLTIDGSLGKTSLNVIIDLAFRVFDTSGAWIIEASNFHLKNISIDKINSNEPLKYLIQLGNHDSEIRNCSLTNCSFISEAVLNNNKFDIVKIQNCDNFILDDCNFGTNETRDFIINFQSGISITQDNSNFNSIISNNRFLSSNLALEMNGGNAIISNNIFGALDRSRAFNFLSPKSAIKFGEMNQVKLDNNFFMDYENVSIECKDFISFIEVKNNEFVRCSTNTIELKHPDIYADIHHNDINSNENFLFVKNCNALKVDSNIVNLVSSFIVIDSIKEFQLFQHLGNHIQCTMNEPIINPNVISPTITEYDGKVLKGRGSPNHTLVIYKRDAVFCRSNCKAGIPIATIPITSEGNWTFNFMRNNRDIISVYQFEPSQSQQLNSSGFSNCDNTLSQLNNAIQNNIFLYPNPTVNYLIVELDNRSERINHIYCYNYLGQSIPLYAENFSNTLYRFNVSDLNSGIYTMEIVLSNSSRITQKFIAE